jgi:hypothetical protein
MASLTDPFIRAGRPPLLPAAPTPDAYMASVMLPMSTAALAPLPAAPPLRSLSCALQQQQQQLGGEDPQGVLAWLRKIRCMLDHTPVAEPVPVFC